MNLVDIIMLLAIAQSLQLFALVIQYVQYSRHKYPALKKDCALFTRINK